MMIFSMIHFGFLAKAFVIGLISAAALGPIFVMTFNRAANYGFRIGFATALGASAADGMFFSLGLIGVLSIIQTSNILLLSVYLLGGLMLVGIGGYSLYSSYKVDSASYLHKMGFFSTIIKTSAVTFLNPSSLIYFGLINLQFFGERLGKLPMISVVNGGLAVMAGSLCMLSMVSFLASHLGARLSGTMLNVISRISGGFFCVIGIYLLSTFVRIILG